MSQYRGIKHLVPPILLSRGRRFSEQDEELLGAGGCARPSLHTSVKTPIRILNIAKSLQDPMTSIGNSTIPRPCGKERHSRGPFHSVWVFSSW